MRAGTAVAIGVVIAILLGAIGFAAYTGSTGDQLRVEWVSDTGVQVEGNHHGVAAGSFDGGQMVFVPRSGTHDTNDCALIALDGSSGEERWRHGIPPGNCWIHAIGSVTLGDLDGDGVREVIAPTTEEAVYAFHPESGDVELRHPLSSYGYSPAVVGRLVPGSTNQLAIVDAGGQVSVIHPNGSVAWRDTREGFVWARPAIADFTDGDGPELAVGFGTGDVTVYRSDGRVAWNTSGPFDGSLTWMAVVGADGDGTTDIVASTTAGEVVLLDGRTGEARWTVDLGDFAAVDAVGDGDGDGDVEVYAVGDRGILRSIDADSGAVEWTSTLTTGEVQMTPPPVLGDVDGDGDPELVAVTNDGTASVVDPATGDVLATYERPVPIWTYATVADTDGDGSDEIYVMYGDGRVVALTFVGADG